MKIDEIKITPSLAKDLLSKRTDEQSRRLNQRHVKKLAGMMSCGEWQELNGDTICIDLNGNLIDGQHRLAAIIDSGKSVKAILVSGLEPDTFYTKDQMARPRGTGDVFRMEGVANHSVIPSGLRRLWYYQRDLSPQWASAGQAPTPKQLKQMYDERPDFYQECARGSLKLRNLITPAMGTFIQMLLLDKSPDEAEKFFGILKTGVATSAKCPVKVLRDKLLVEKASKSKLPIADKIMAILHAWNLFREGRQVRAIKIPKRRAGNKFFIKVA
jgi:hypothetical protein